MRQAPRPALAEWLPVRRANVINRSSRLRATFHRRVFDALYRHGRWVYDPVTRAVFGPEWERWRQTALPFVPPGPALELGCGTGGLLHPLAARSDALVVGLDLSSSMLRAAAGHLAHADPRADARALPFRDRSFASCVTTFPAPFILEAATLDEVVRVLVPGGTVVVVLSAYLRHPPIRRLPIGLALTLFYGAEPGTAPTPPAGLAHPALDGRVVNADTAWGGTWLWLAHTVQRETGPAH